MTIVWEGASRTGLSIVKSPFLSHVYLLYPQNISSVRRTATLHSSKGEISIILSIQNLKFLKMIHQSKSYTNVFLHEFIWRIIFLFHITFSSFVQAYHIAVFCVMTPCSLAGRYQPYGTVYFPPTPCLDLVMHFRALWTHSKQLTINVRTAPFFCQRENGETITEWTVGIQLSWFVLCGL